MRYLVLQSTCKMPSAREEYPGLAIDDESYSFPIFNIDIFSNQNAKFDYTYIDIFATMESSMDR